MATVWLLTGHAWPSQAWLRQAWPSLAKPRPGQAWPSLAKPGLAKPGQAQAWPGLAKPGQAWPGQAKQQQQQLFKDYWRSVYGDALAIVLPDLLGPFARDIDTLADNPC